MKTDFKKTATIYSLNVVLACEGSGIDRQSTAIPCLFELQVAEDGTPDFMTIPGRDQVLRLRDGLNRYLESLTEV